jgi:DNA-binding CsgD family transcriptional regulator
LNADWIAADASVDASRTRATAAEHVRLSEEHDYRLLQCRGLFLQSMLAAAAGDDEAVATITDRLTAWAVPRRVTAVERLAAHVPHALWLILDHPWCGRASTELRATGLTSDRAPAATAPLTPQQREIAALAASGLTNKQIAERLFLSPRTVSTHLYQIFPKLGITSRAALRDALTGHAGRSGSPGR